ncbi:hypothetical protein HJG60_011692 [Phyllostomus discolor]|uniref:Uncharacterized protein n=1 Tax=Phyllostomus discolor TaxID=89673 RepID=A0A833ZZG9_9CHIR|nr:hypothetical protein HJG60_011692 [Phyllostomus discolor]
MRTLEIVRAREYVREWSLTVLNEAGRIMLLFIDVEELSRVRIRCTTSKVTDWLHHFAWWVDFNQDPKVTSHEVKFKCQNIVENCKIRYPKIWNARVDFSSKIGSSLPSPPSSSGFRALSLRQGHEKYIPAEAPALLKGSPPQHRNVGAATIKLLLDFNQVCLC